MVLYCCTEVQASRCAAHAQSDGEQEHSEADVNRDQRASLVVVRLGTQTFLGAQFNRFFRPCFAFVSQGGAREVDVGRAVRLDGSGKFED